MKFIGKLCVKHPEANGQRYGGGSCVLCQNQRTKDWYKKNKQRHAVMTATQYQKKWKKWRQEHPEHVADIAKRCRERNPEKSRMWARRWRERNRQRWLENGKQSWIRRYALIGNQKISKAYTEEIRAIYRKCPTGFHVDHIIPLRGKGVNGLHVPWNLQ